MKSPRPIYAVFLAILALVVGCLSPVRRSQTATDSTKSEGLGTTFGEERPSELTQVDFKRAPSPAAVTSLWYNDLPGIQSMLGTTKGVDEPKAILETLNGLFTVSLEDAAGKALPGIRSKDRLYIIGERGQRYAIALENRSNVRLLTVVSVDGLDVIDGQPASVNKRGYILEPNSRELIEGYRTSERTVAAFRFGTVTESYTNRSATGTTNVGVIGVAVFAEEGVTPSSGPPSAEQRKDANPFPVDPPKDQAK